MMVATVWNTTMEQTVDLSSDSWDLGTVTKSRFGNRGLSDRQIGSEKHTAPWHMEEAASQVAEAINEYVMKQANG